MHFKKFSEIYKKLYIKLKVKLISSSQTKPSNHFFKIVWNEHICILPLSVKKKKKKKSIFVSTKHN